MVKKNDYSPEAPKTFVEKVEYVFEKTKKYLTKDDVEIINDLIIHGESDVAFEILIDQLSEYSPPITLELYNLIVEICHYLKSRESSLGHFKNLVIKNEL